MTASQTSESKPVKAATPEVKALWHRRIYLDIRLPELRQQTKDLADEMKVVGSAVKNKDRQGGDDGKKIHQRHIYLVHRRAALKAELAALSEERKEVVEKLRDLKDK